MKRLLLATAPGIRLDIFVARSCGLARSQVQKHIKEGHIRVNGRRVKAGYELHPGDRVEVAIPPRPPSELVPLEMPLNIVYEDDDLVVVDKPAGLTVHPAPGHARDTLVNALLARYSGLPGELPRPGLVHRLDKDTSGLLVVAKNPRAHDFMSRQFKERKVVKRYLTLVKGRVTPEEGTIIAPIARHPRQRQRMAIVREGREATTRYRVVQHLKGYTLVEAMPETGRTHQIRVHFASRGHPVAGDPIYGVKVPFLSRQFLHASYLKFNLPQGGEIELTSPLPPDLQSALDYLNALSGS